MTELPGTAYLLDLSLVAMVVAMASPLVVLVGDTKGGKRATFDMSLFMTCASQALVAAVAAILPPLVAQFEPSLIGVWAMASGLSALLLAGVIVNSQLPRWRASRFGISSGGMVIFATYGAAVVLLAANATLSRVQGVGLHAVAVTFFVVALLVEFVCRLGARPAAE